MEKTEISEIINLLNSIYVHKQIKITNNVINVWYDMIGEYSKNQVVDLIKKIAKEKTYAPNLATLTEELSKTFKISTLRMEKSITVFVDFVDSRFPFVFENNERANELINFLKTNPTLEDIEKLHKEHINSRVSFVTGMRIDSKLMAEMELEAKQAYYRRMNAKYGH